MQTELPVAHLLHNRIKILDGFRGLAILLVCGYHYLDVFSFGWVGVDLFFVLSGFLITGKLVAAAGAEKYFSTFYTKRLLRIVPLYYTALLIFFVIIPLVLPFYVSASFKELLQQQVYYWTFTVNIYDALQGWPRNVTLIHFWSLACEMQFYLLWPWVVYFFYNERKMRSTAAACIIIFLLAVAVRTGGNYITSLHGIYRYVLLPCRMDAFAAGAFLYLMVRSGAQARYKSLFGFMAIIAAALALLLALVTGSRWHFGAAPVSQYGFTLNAVFWFSCIGFLFGEGSALCKKVFTGRFLTALGKYSYGIYVFHLPVYVIIARQQLLNTGGEDKNWLLAGVAFVTTCLCSFASYHLMEKHFLKLKPAW